MNVDNVKLVSKGSDIRKFILVSQDVITIILANDTCRNKFKSLIYNNFLLTYIGQSQDFSTNLDVYIFPKSYLHTCLKLTLENEVGSH
jgi:hypothetical protein